MVALAELRRASRQAGPDACRNREAPAGRRLTVRADPVLGYVVEGRYV